MEIDILDLGEEADFGRVHGVLFGQKELELEDATWGSGELAIISVSIRVAGDLHCIGPLSCVSRRITRDTGAQGGPQGGPLPHLQSYGTKTLSAASPALLALLFLSNIP